MNKWRFPAANHGVQKGISTGDVETFKKDPYASFAREILQNSIDVAKYDDKPVIVEFKELDINTDDIPGVDDLKDAIKNCINYWQSKTEYVNEYQKMLNVLNRGRVKCLRISDFNTYGLLGVESNDMEGNNFLALTRGSGVSEKTSGTAGGSKGIGKNAAFLLSSLKTIFYSTKTSCDKNHNPGNYEGTLGVADFITGSILNSEDYTQGKGFYGTNDKNDAVSAWTTLDKNFIRNDDGTDIYIIGFEAEEKWNIEVLNSILSSFMVAIVRKKLEVKLNGEIVNADTVKKYLNDEYLSKNLKNDIISQYKLCTNEDNNVQTYIIQTSFGECNLFFMTYDKSMESLATHCCKMIRYPYMKICDRKLGAYPVSAICIIENNILGSKLRLIENPQHNSWEPSRIKDKFIRKEYSSVLNDEIYLKITEIIQNYLKDDSNTPLDPNEAGKYLPEDDTENKDNSYASKSQAPEDSTSVTEPKEIAPIEKRPNDNNSGEGIQPEPAQESDGPDKGYVPHGENSGHGGNHHPGVPTKVEPGDNIVYKKNNLSGVRYNVISLDKTKGLIRITFISPINCERCYVKLGLLDDVSSYEKVEILNAKCNNIEISSKNNIEYGPFPIEEKKKCILDIKTSLNGLFACDVKIIYEEERPIKE